MGKRVQVNPPYDYVLLPTANGLRNFRTNATADLTDVEFAALSANTVRLITVTSTIPDPARTSPTNPQSLSDAVSAAESYANSAVANLAAQVQLPWLDGVAHGIVPGSSTLSADLQALSQANPKRTIFLRAGTYAFTAPVQLFGPLIGEGITSTICQFPEIANAAFRYLVGSDGALMKDLAIVSTSTEDWNAPSGLAISTSSSHGIIFDTITGFRIDNVLVSGRFRMGIHIRNVSRGTISGCTVFNTAYDGIHTTNGSTDVSIIGNHVVNSGDDGIPIVSYNTDAAQNQRIIVTGNTVKNSRNARGLVCLGGLDCEFTGNIVQQVASRALLISSITAATGDTWAATNCVAASNLLENAAAMGVQISGNNANAVVRGNTIKTPAQQGIHLLGAPGAIIENNLVSDNGAGNGIEVTNNTGNLACQVKNNVVRRPASRGIYNEGVGTVIVDNTVDHPAQVTSPSNAITVFNCNGVLVRGNRVYATDTTHTQFGVELSGTSAGNTSRCLDNHISWDSSPGTEIFVSATVTGLIRANNAPIDQSFPALTSEASNATPTPPATSPVSYYYLTALAVNATFAAPSGTRLDGSMLYIRIKDNGTARTLAWNTIYRSMTATLPTTTVISKTIWLAFQANFADGKYDLVSVVNQP